MQISHAMLSIAVLLVLTGCGTTGVGPFMDDKITRAKDDANDPVPGMRISGPDPVLARYKVEPINLMIMIDPNGKARVNYDNNRASYSRDWKDLTLDERYEYGYHAFYDGYTSLDLQERRNRIQDRIIQAADVRCSMYKKLLFETQSNANFWLGLGSTIAGVMGPLFGDRGSKNLAVLAGGLGGARAEINQDYFYNLTATVITSGITLARNDIYNRISSSRKLTIEQYTLQKAIDDVLIYDGACSAVSGMEEAQAAINFATDPGIDAANRILLKTKATASLINNGDNLDKINEDLRKLQDSPLFSSGRFITVGGNLTAMPDAGHQNSPALSAIKLYDSRFPSTALANYSDQLNTALKAAQLPIKTGENMTEGFNKALTGFSKVYDLYNKMSNNCSTKLQSDAGTYTKQTAKLADPTLTESDKQVLMASQNLLRAKSSLVYDVMNGVRDNILQAQAKYQTDMLATFKQLYNGKDTSKVEVANIKTLDDSSAATMLKAVEDQLRKDPDCSALYQANGG